MNKRSYLRELGFEVGNRGRFSSDMQAAIDKAIAQGISFDDAGPITNSIKEEAATPEEEAKPYDAKAIRAWAGQNNVHIGPRGRIKQEIVEEYYATTGQDRPVKAISVSSDKAISMASGRNDAGPDNTDSTITVSRLPMAVPTKTRARIRSHTTAYALVPIGEHTKRKVVIGVSTCSAGHSISTCTCAVMKGGRLVDGALLSLTRP